MKRKWPRPGETSADGEHYTATDGRVYERMECTLCSYCGLLCSDDCILAPCSMTHGWSTKHIAKVRVPK